MSCNPKIQQTSERSEKSNPPAEIASLRYRPSFSLYLFFQVVYNNVGEQKLSITVYFMMYLVLFNSPTLSNRPFSTPFFKSRLAVADEISLNTSI